MGKMIGIDLGTTNSVAAIVDGPIPRVLDNREGKPQTRSVVGYRKRRGASASGDGELLTGDVALDNWPMAPRDTIISIKRLMGRGISDEEVQKIRAHALFEIQEPVDGTRDSVAVVIAGRQYSPIDISATILGKVKSDAEFKLGEEVTHAVITVPAYFSQIQRDATRRAGLKAGLKVMKILDEPTAAAVAFGVDSTDNAEPKTILVYDLGGGTFDISVLMWAGHTFAPLTLEGDMWLGGDNFDQAIVEHVVNSVKQEYRIDPTGDRPFMVALKKMAQAAKERLSSARSTDLIIANMLKDSDGDYISVDMEITRDQFEKMIRPLVDRTVRLTKKALDNAGYTPEQIDCVLMAGNSTTVPLVQQAIESMFGAKKLMRKVHPKHSVAIGAALLAARLSGVVCQARAGTSKDKSKEECGEVNALDATRCRKCGTTLQYDAPRHGVPEIKLDNIGCIAAFHYGAQLANDEFRLFIEKSDSYPTLEPRTQTFYTQIPNQRIIAIPVYGGDVLEKASANQKQGEAFAILSPGLPKDTAIRISVWLNADGIFELSAHLEDGTDLKPWILRGETDTKAVHAMEDVERALAARAASVSPEQARSLEVARNKAFDFLRGGQFDRALDQANAVVEMAGEIKDEKDQLLVRAENLIGFTEMILYQYGWALDPNRSIRLGSLLEEAKTTLGEWEQARGAKKTQSAEALAAKLEAIDQQTETLPEAIQVFLSIRGAIAMRVGARDPSLAARFMMEVAAVEQAYQARQPNADALLQALVTKLTQALQDGQEGGFKCPNGHQMPPGTRYCPVPTCNWDSWGMGGGKAASTTGNVFRRM